MLGHSPWIKYKFWYAFHFHFLNKNTSVEAIGGNQRVQSISKELVCIYSNKWKWWTRVVHWFLPKEFREALPSDWKHYDGDRSQRNDDREAQSGGGSNAKGISTWKSIDRLILACMDVVIIWLNFLHFNFYTCFPIFIFFSLFHLGSYAFKRYHMIITLV